MADFNLAVQKTLVHEGGYVDNPNDPGGATNHGITQKDMPGVDMKTVTPEQAAVYYQEHYWKALYSQIDSQLVAEKLFDMGVLLGIGMAVRILQLTLGITVDGGFGQQSLQAVNEAEEVSLLRDYKTNLATHFVNIANAKPTSRIFLVGWLRRVNS